MAHDVAGSSPCAREAPGIAAYHDPNGGDEMAVKETATRRELAHRWIDGIEVTLFWVRAEGDDETVVCACDSREGAYFEIPTQPNRALDVYYHPFAYRDFSTVAYQDSRLAA
jgi:hypothetical protein